MHDAETRALRHAVVVLLALSVLRWGWGTLRPPAHIEGADVLPTLTAESRSRLEDAKERARPLAPGERLDPDHATAVELDRLPGVGPGIAADMVREREAHGPYRTPEALTRVRGIGPATLQKLLPHLRFGSSPVEGPVSSDVRRPPAASSATPRRTAPGDTLQLVDLNSADEATLETLPGVGPALARRILEARKERPFRSVDDLTRVRGIGPATLRRLRGRVRVHG
jgi:competence ComEA-like helix-hairpin-helix protein